MQKYIEPLLIIMILAMIWLCVMRIHYIWSIHKMDNKPLSFTFRNQEGDLSILFFILLVMNKSRFDRYKLSYQPLLRHFYLIVVGIFIAYTVLQLTQFVVLSQSTLMTQEGMIDMEHIKQYRFKKHMYGYKLSIDYLKKDKEKKMTFFIGRKQKEAIEARFKEIDVNIV